MNLKKMTLETLKEKPKIDFYLLKSASLRLAKLTFTC